MSTTPPSALRIISGKFRSRKIIFSAAEGLRPTHNRIRETLFNWLAQDIKNSVCLDAFSGSGALGFEALSRGAQHVTFCDVSQHVIHDLKINAAALSATNAEFIEGDFTQEKTISAIKHKSFNIVFLDPPFQKNLLLRGCELLITHQLLYKNAMLYLEFQKGSVDLSQLPSECGIQKHKHTQTIEYVLCEFNPPQSLPIYSHQCFPEKHV